MAKIKVSIVEDDLNYQSWILKTLEKSEDINCISIHSDGEHVLTGLPSPNPDIVLMDLTLENSKYNGIECILRLRIRNPKLKFLVLSAHSNESKIFNALRAGAGAYIHKEETNSKQLIKSILNFHQGEAPMSPGIAKRIIKNLQHSPEDLMLLQTLSNKEKEVLERLSKGKLYKEVAYELGIKEGTVKSHTHNIYQKLQVFNAVEAILKYLNIKN